MNSKIKYTNNPLHNNNYNININNHSTENNYIVNDFYEEMNDPIETNKKWSCCNFLYYFTNCFSK